MKRIETKSGLIAFLALLLVLCTMLGVLFTQGRYVKNAESGSEIYGSDMNFIVSEQIEVNNVEEFIAAVENGYSNVKISDEVENPLIITSGVTDVGADLILDLNGHEIQRNNREPMLNIVDGVRMTIIDSSRTQAGAFYNPVGSVLQIGGGTLTVTAGAFVSGPKKSEYAQLSGSAWTAGTAVNGTGGTIAGSVDGTLYTRDTSGGGGYTPTENASVPKITPATVSDTQTGKYVNGNMYFDKGTAPSGYSDLLRADTYLYYVVDDAAFNTSSILADTNTADFYYTYEDGSATVTVYGYHYVKETAQNNGAPVGTPADPDNSFAAIRMSGGNMYVRGGSYTTNFGCGTAYGLFATGGYMAVETGSFVAIEEGVCIECNYSAPSDEDYLRVSGGTFSSQNGDTVRVYSGEMVVTGGSFVKDSDRVVSEGETPSAGMTSAVHVKGGTLTASNAAFLLSGSAQYGIYSEDDKDESGTVRSGTVSLTNVSIQFVKDTSDVADEANRDTSVSHNYGVYAAADITLNGDCTVDVSGAWSGGLLAQGGDITYGNTHPGTLNVTMRMDMGKTSLSSSAIAAVDGKITFNGKNSQVNVKSDGIGVAVRQETSSQAETEKRGIELTAGSMNITTTRATALYVSGGSATFASTTKVTVNSKGNDSCTVPLESGTGYMYDGVYVQGGSLAVAGAFTATHGGYGAAVRVNEGNAYFAGTDGASVTKNNVTYNKDLTSALYDGVRVDGGTLSVGYENNGTATAGTLTVTHYGIGAGVYVGSGKFVTYGTSKVTVTNDLTRDQNGNQISVTSQAGANVSYDGVYVGGTLDASGATLNVTHRGTANVIPSGTAFTVHETYTMTSYAVYVDAGAQDEVKITNGTITNSVGGGIYVGGGKVTLGVENSTKHADLQIRTTGGVDDDDDDTNDDNESGWSDWYGENAGYAGNWPYRLSKRGGNAVDVDGGTLTVHGGVFTANQGNGIVTRGGTATINGGYFYGNDVYLSREDNPVAGPGASYAFKVYGGTATVNGGTFGQQVSDNGTLIEDSYSAGSGAFVMGTDSNTLGTAEILGGTFQVAGQAGFSIYQYADVTFGKAGASNDDLTVAGGVTAMALEKEHSTNTKVTIYSGTFTGKNKTGDVDAVWYGNAAVTLNINGGKFESANRSGLYIDNTTNADRSSQSGGSVTIGSGAFTGVQDGITYNRNVSLNISGGTFTGNDVGLRIASNHPDSGEIQLSGGEYHGSERGVNYGGSNPNLFYWRYILQDNHNVYSSASGGSALNAWGNWPWDLAGDIVNNNNNKDIYVR